MVRGLLVAAMLLFAQLAWAGEVVLKDGSRVAGDIVKMDSERVFMRDSHGIDMQIPRIQVRSMHFPGLEAPSGRGVRDVISRKGDELGESVRFEGQIKKMTLAEALLADAGDYVQVRGSYGRVISGVVAIAQGPGKWYLNNGDEELVIHGKAPDKLSSYGTEHWGSLVEATGRLRGQAGKARWLELESVTLIRRRSSPVPSHD
jgi:hypothetical protein